MARTLLLPLLAMGCVGEFVDDLPAEDGAPRDAATELAATDDAPDDAVGDDRAAEDALAPVDAEAPDAGADAAREATADGTADAAPDVARDGAPADVGRDVAPDVAPPQCVGSASGTSDVWACTGDRAARQRCVGGATQTERCPYGCNAAAGGALCGCGSMSGFTVWNCLPSGNLGRCRGGAWEEQSCMGHGCAARPVGVDDVCNGPPPPPGSLSCSNLQWWNSSLTFAHVSSGWNDTDLAVPSGTRVQLRHNARLDNTGVYAWGYMPEFTDQVTGLRFRFLHLRPQNQYATERGRVYPAGFVVGLSGGDTRDTGLPTYSTGAHLCVQTLVAYRTAFPTGRDACR